MLWCKKRRRFPRTYKSAGTILAERYGHGNVVIGIRVSAVPSHHGFIRQCDGDSPVGGDGRRRVLEEMTNKAGVAYQEIKGRIEQSAVVGVDETGCHDNGKRQWMYVWQNGRLSYLVPSEQRNYETIEREFPEGLPLATVVSDCLAMQLKTPAKWHQICVGAHLLRELKNFWR